MKYDVAKGGVNLPINLTPPVRNVSHCDERLRQLIELMQSIRDACKALLPSLDGYYFGYYTERIRIGIGDITKQLWGAFGLVSKIEYCFENPEVAACERYVGLLPILEQLQRDLERYACDDCSPSQREKECLYEAATRRGDYYGINYENATSSLSSLVAFTNMCAIIIGVYVSDDLSVSSEKRPSLRELKNKSAINLTVLAAKDLDSLKGKVLDNNGWKDFPPSFGVTINYLSMRGQKGMYAHANKYRELRRLLKEAMKGYDKDLTCEIMGKITDHSAGHSKTLGLTTAEWAKANSWNETPRATAGVDCAIGLTELLAEELRLVKEKAKCAPRKAEILALYKIITANLSLCGREIMEQVIYWDKCKDAFPYCRIMMLAYADYFMVIREHLSSTGRLSSKGHDMDAAIEASMRLSQLLRAAKDGAKVEREQIT